MPLNISQPPPADEDPWPLPAGEDPWLPTGLTEMVNASGRDEPLTRHDPEEDDQ